jgi:hypothetical protein
MTQNAIETVNLIWEKAKDLVLYWDGSATELFILNVPLEKLSVVLNRIKEFSQNPTVLTVDYWTLENELTLDNETTNRILQTSSQYSQHVIRGNFSEQETCVYYLWIDTDEKLIDVEMVFWNDTSFPSERTEQEHKATLAKYIEVANYIKVLGENSTCVLSGEWNGNHKELLEKEWAVIW